LYDAYFAKYCKLNLTKHIFSNILTTSVVWDTILHWATVCCSKANCDTPFNRLAFWACYFTVPGEISSWVLCSRWAVHCLSSLYLVGILIQLMSHVIHAVYLRGTFIFLCRYYIIISVKSGGKLVKKLYLVGQELCIFGETSVTLIRHSEHSELTFWYLKFLILKEVVRERNSVVHVKHSVWKYGFSSVGIICSTKPSVQIEFHSSGTRCELFWNLGNLLLSEAGGT
jgi:hypothetical protein